MYGSSRSISKLEVVGSNGNGSGSGSPGRSPRLPRSPRLGHRRNSSSSSTGGLTGSGKTLSMENIQSMNAAYAAGGPTYFTDTAEDPVGIGSLGSGLNPSLPKSTMTLGRAGFRVPSGVRAAIIGSSPNINSGAVVPSDAIAFGGEMQSQTSQAATVPHSMRQARDGALSDLQTQLREVLRENELLRRELEAKESKLSSSMNSIKTFWSPELKKERALRKDEATKVAVWKEQYRAVQEETQVRFSLTTEGLYRVSGNKTDQDNIQKLFDQDHSIDFVVMDVAVNAAAGALKAFFADLPEPLIPYSLHPELVEAAKIVDHIERLQVLREILKKFPPVNYQVFKYIITHLNRVSQQSKTTLMTADNLSICFWPTLMRPDFENKDTLSTTKLNQAVIESFIIQSDYFFHGGEVAESSSSEGTPPPHCHNMVEALLPLQLPPPLQPQQIQHAVHPDPLI